MGVKHCSKASQPRTDRKNPISAILVYNTSKAHSNNLSFTQRRCREETSSVANSHLHNITSRKVNRAKTSQSNVNTNESTILTCDANRDLRDSGTRKCSKISSRSSVNETRMNTRTTSSSDMDNSKSFQNVKTDEQTYQIDCPHPRKHQYFGDSVTKSVINESSEIVSPSSKATDDGTFITQNPAEDLNLLSELNNSASSAKIAWQEDGGAVSVPLERHKTIVSEEEIEGWVEQEPVSYTHLTLPTICSV